MAWLVALTGELAGQRFPLDRPCLLGRGPYNHVFLDDMRISRQHTRIAPERGGYVVFDLNTVNGTYVNEVAVRRKLLVVGDQVRIGPYSFRFELQEGERLASSPSPTALDERTAPRVSPPAARILATREATAPQPTAPQNQLDFGQIADGYQHLRTLHEFMQTIATSLDTGELVEAVTLGLLAVFPTARRVAVYLLDDRGTAIPRLVRPRAERTAGDLRLPAQLHEQVVERGCAVLWSPAADAPTTDETMGVAMLAPIIFRDSSRGALLVEGDAVSGRLFSRHDLELLSGLAAETALALDNAQLHDAWIEQQRQRQDLALAEQIQRSFLPRHLPSVEGMDFVIEYRPAYWLGGDFYDLFWLDGRRLAVFIGDVAGKGVAAALVMARVASDLRFAAMAERDAAAVLARANRSTLELDRPEIFVTGVYLTLDVATREVCLANAGHVPPLVRRQRQGTVERIEEDVGPAMGFFADAAYGQQTFRLETGDSLVLCTDGITEAADRFGQQFGLARLEASLADAPPAPDALALRLLTDLRAHVDGAVQIDDLALVILGVTDRPSLRQPSPRRRATTLSEIPMEAGAEVRSP